MLAWGRVLEFAEAARPPVEAGRGADAIRPGRQRHAAGGLGLLQVVQGLEVLVGERRVGQRPELLGRIELGGVSGQEEQVEVVGHARSRGRQKAVTSTGTGW
jgi:hypothetical protein